MTTQKEIKELEKVLDDQQDSSRDLDKLLDETEAQNMRGLRDALAGTSPGLEVDIIDTRTETPPAPAVASLKEGDRVRWKVTSTFFMTTVAGQRAEVISVIPQRDGLHTNFKNLDYPGATEHTFVVVGEIPADAYEIIA